MLENMQIVIRHRCVVELRQMPDRDREIEDDEADRSAGEEPRDRRNAWSRQHGSQHPTRHSGEQKWRYRQREQEMLHHVRAEEIIIAQIVYRTIERGEHQEQTREEEASLGE